jgi:reductive dehalogenase
MAVLADVSVHEKELRAAKRALILALVLPLPYLAAGLLPLDFMVFVAAALVILTGAAVFVLVIPAGGAGLPTDVTPVQRFDERDIMFSRAELKPDTERFESYYSLRPENREPDDEFRLEPGLLKPGTLHYDPVIFSAARATFTTVKQFQPIVDGEPAADRFDVAPDRITGFVRGWTEQLGAVATGVTELRDYHMYTVAGRGADYGLPVELPHKYAIAFTVEMEKEMVDAAPGGATVMESAQQYLHAGTIATQLAELIRRLGYPARAHIDGNYRVVCPLVARDAGLGEIGRMGLLMTPKLGPRVRIGVVTTDMPLVTSERRYDATKIDFCRICKKCAEVCPSKSIPFGDRELHDGVARWRINQETCYTYWCVAGTDCARCMRVCPYSHPDGFLHNVIRAGIRNSALFRRFALRADDFFYGRKPPPSPPPNWLT